MSARNGFSPQLLAEAARGSAMMERMATKTNIVRVAPADTNMVNARFPVQISSPDEEDQQRELQAKILNGSTRVPGVGVSIVDDGYWAYAKRKMDDQQEAAFKAWVLQNADLSTPALTDWWFKKVPWLKTNREEVIDYVSDLQKQAAKIALNGPQSEEDLRFIFLKENELITIPPEPVQNLSNWAAPGQVTYQQGFFNPFAQKLKTRFPAVIEQNSKLKWANPLGPPTALVGSQTPANFWNSNPNPLGARAAR